MFGLLPPILGASPAAQPETFALRAVMQQSANLTGRRAGSMWAMLGSGSTAGTPAETFGRRATMQQAGNLTGRRAGSMYAMLGSS